MCIQLVNPHMLGYVCFWQLISCSCYEYGFLKHLKMSFKLTATYISTHEIMSVLKHNAVPTAFTRDIQDCYQVSGEFQVSIYSL